MEQMRRRPLDDNGRSDDRLRPIIVAAATVSAVLLLAAVAIHDGDSLLLAPMMQ